MDGDPSRTKWIMQGANAEYRIGRFDGFTFTPETGRIPLRKGTHYAAQVWNDTPDGRKIMIAWGSVRTPGMPFNSMMMFPTELRLVTTAAGLRVLPAPVRELAGLHRDTLSVPPFSLHRDSSLTLPVPDRAALRISVQIEATNVFKWTLNVAGFDLTYDALNQRLNDVQLPADASGNVHLDILLDRTTIEVFGNDGRAYLLHAHVSPLTDRRITLNSTVPDWQAGERHLFVDEFRVVRLADAWRREGRSE